MLYNCLASLLQTVKWFIDLLDREPWLSADVSINWKIPLKGSFLATTISRKAQIT